MRHNFIIINLLLKVTEKMDKKMIQMIKYLVTGGCYLQRLDHRNIFLILNVYYFFGPLSRVVIEDSMLVILYVWTQKQLMISISVVELCLELRVVVMIL